MGRFVKDFLVKDFPEPVSFDKSARMDSFVNNHKGRDFS
jgi:hypothetical protein